MILLSFLFFVSGERWSFCEGWRKGIFYYQVSNRLLNKFLGFGLQGIGIAIVAGVMILLVT